MGGSVIEAVAAFSFRLREGHALDALDGGLTEEECLHTALLALGEDPTPPNDCTSNYVVDSVVSFRFPRRGESLARAGKVGSLADAAKSEQKGRQQEDFLHGVALRREKGNAAGFERGCERQAVAVLSTWPVVRALEQVALAVGPVYFSEGASSLSKAYEKLSSVSMPEPGGERLLSLGNTEIAVGSPEAIFADSQEGIPEGAHVTALADWAPGQGHSASRLFLGLEGDMWLLWEVCVLGEPVLLSAPDAPSASEAVIALVAMMSPLPPGADYRPYFHVHDPLHSALSRCPESPPPVWLGVCNRMLVQGLASFPNVCAARSILRRQGDGDGRQAKKPVLERIGAFLLRRRLGPMALIRECWGENALWAERRSQRLVAKDDALLRRACDASKRGHEGNASRILMKHFQRLSREVASTFVPYLAASSDESGKYSLLDFDAESFLARVRRSAFEGRLPRLASLTGSIDRLLSFFRCFLESPTLQQWLPERRAVARLGRVHRPMTGLSSELFNIDRLTWLERLIGEALREGRDLESDDKGVEETRHLLLEFRRVANLLPEDARNLLLLNPWRRRLLGKD